MKATVLITPEIEASITEAEAIIAMMDRKRIEELQASVVYSDEEEAAYAAYLEGR